MEPDEQESLIASLYDAGMEPERWPETLLRLGQAFDGLGGQYFLWDPASNRAPFNVMSGPPPGTAEQYIEYFGSVDPKLKYALAMPVGDWLLCNEVFDNQFVSKSEFYQDYFIPRGGRYLAGTRLLEANGQSALLGLFRPVGGKPFSREDKAQLKTLTPHMQRAARMQLKLAAATAKVHLLESMLDALPDPLIAVNGAGVVRYVNKAGEQFFRASLGLIEIRSNRLWVGQADTAIHLKRCIADAAGGVGGALRIVASKADGRVCFLSLCPLGPSLVAMEREREPLALVFIAVPALGGTPPPATLRALFAFTPAECRLAEKLMRGAAVDQAALDLGVAVSTLRSQISSMLAKTGTTRQAELLALLTGIRGGSTPFK